MGRDRKLNLRSGAWALGWACAACAGMAAGGAYAVDSNGNYSTQTVGATITNTSVTVRSAGNVGMSVVGTPEGALVVGRGRVSVETDASTGYRLYVSGFKYDESSRYAGLYLDGDQNAAQIPAVQSSTPVTLGNNQWGFAVAGDATNGFAAGELYEAAVERQVTSVTSDKNALKWKGMQGDYQFLAANTEANMGNPTNTDVYYGAHVTNTGLALGNYLNTIIYTAFVDGGSAISVAGTGLSSVDGKTVVDLASAGDSTTVTIATSHQSSDMPVQNSEISVKLYDSANASSNIATCTNIQVLDGYDGTYGRPLRFTCTLTRGADVVSSKDKFYDAMVSVNMNGSGIAITYEEQDFWRYKTTYGYTISYAGDSVDIAPTKGSLPEGVTQNVTISGTTPTRSNYNFSGWDIDGNGSADVQPGGTVSISESNSTPTLTAVWVEQTWTYSFAYDLKGGTYNGSSTISVPDGTGTVGRATTSSKSFTVVSTSDSNPTKDNHTFLGWSTNPSATTADAGFAKGDTPTIILTPTDSTKTLHAVWKANKTYFQTVGTSQTEAQNWCKGLTIWTSSNNAEYTLYDSRDEKGYLVRRLADGNCWMVQNLALEGGKTIYPSDSNVTSNYTLPSSNTSGWSDNSTAYMWNGTKHLDATQNNAPVTDNTTSPENTGAYYSFIAATAGTGTGSSGPASSSICPKWWHLPTSGDDAKEFAQLYKAYSSTTSTFNEAFNVAFPGYCNSSDCPYASGSAFYWSASINSGTSGYVLYTNSSSTNPSGGNSKKYGRSVRCMLTGEL